MIKLYGKVFNLNPANILYFKSINNYNINQYFNYFPWLKTRKTYKNLKSELTKEFKSIISKIISKAHNRTIVIPLSAGLDSRFIASGLRAYGYKNVKCFSYGRKNNFESLASKKISKKLGYEWAFVNITQKNVKNFYLSKNYNKYITDTNDGCSASTIQGLYAIDRLLSSGFISKKDIIVNGNSGDFISGGHIPEKFLFKKVVIEENNILPNILFNSHYEKHYQLWETISNLKNKNIIKNLLERQLKDNLKFKYNKLNASGILEYLEFHNRQTKFVVNCQRIYDFYKIDWMLPLWNRSFIKFWEKVPLELKINQKLYKDTLEYMKT